MFKIAYLVLAHHDPIHLERLVRAINYNSHIFIHLDLKTDNSKYLHIADMKSVDFIPERIKVYWGGISMIEAILSLIKAALVSKENFSHLVLISGADYPIKPVSTFYDFLKGNADRQFIKFINLNESPEPDKRRLSDYWFMEPLQPFYNDSLLRRFLQKLFHLGVTKKPLDNLSPTWGSGNWAITPDCAAFILQYLEKNPDFLNFYKYAHAPDEHLFHTIVANSPFIQNAGGFREEIKWPHEVSNITLNFEGRIFVENDYEFLEDLSLDRTPTRQRMSSELSNLIETCEIFNQSDFFFARKFTTEQSSGLLNLIDNHLLRS
jgi:Core-2/I-Branching enzyme